MQQSLKDMLCNKIKHLPGTTLPDASFRVKLVGSYELSYRVHGGTTIGKLLHIVNFTYVLLDEGEKAYCAEGNHSLAIFREQENYESFKMLWRTSLLKLMQWSLLVWTAQSKTEFFLGGLWKVLAIITAKPLMYTHTTDTMYITCMCYVARYLFCRDWHVQCLFYICLRLVQVLKRWEAQYDQK